ncbi:hypothetical protein [Singulisphaera sp. PoT]|uniref:hypothetical protein n=1 Tax=Singulisphaera sp. PoT TaxID=3411797 RepID=UPI003BF55B52
MPTTEWFIKYVCLFFVAASSVTIIFMTTFMRYKRDANLIKQLLKDQDFEDISIKHKLRTFPLHQWSFSKLSKWSMPNSLHYVYYVTFRSVIEPGKGGAQRAWFLVNHDGSIDIDMDEVEAKKERFDEI